MPPTQEDYLGPAGIETYTVIYDREGTPTQGAIVARSPGGARFIAKVPAVDRAAINFLTSGAHEPVGAAGIAIRGSDGDTWWQMAP